MVHTRGSGILTPLLLFSNLLIIVSSMIVLGITAWFIDIIKDSGGRHLTYLIVVATLTLLVYPVALLLSRSDARRGYLHPLNLIFSYLWLAAFVVATDSYADTMCLGAFAGPFGRCAYKHTVMAFSFIPFFFAAVNVLAEGHYAGRVAGDPAVGTKHHSTDNRAAVV
ncbi:hypothetical protein MAPG_08831 [Magnaporthiopsis poae ATCC 64411]|uniref:MARVEL domain-containing protein n=1 Tax=Magnaporthiopsis poae (strain ATCC 64411 / 73-15) TaxID=644358 RepID=A0A0C4E8D0_MAGP6|nr:hypothetical protein MAPG_08831 [Magnaporthiopsis poae ATCC 64411]